MRKNSSSETEQQSVVSKARPDTVTEIEEEQRRRRVVELLEATQKFLVFDILIRTLVVTRRGDKRRERGRELLN